MTRPLQLLLFLTITLWSLPSKAEVLAEYQQPNITDSHLVDRPALFVKEGQPITPLLQTGSFSVTWSGTITLDKRQRLTFSFTGSGTASLTINSEKILQESGHLGHARSPRLRLNSGSHPFTLTYHSPPKGSSRFQLLWEERSFPLEPVPANAFGKLEPSSAKSSNIYRGRELVAHHLCTKCHLPNNSFGPNAMPELSHLPPLLALTGEHLHQNWLAEWIYDPASIRPHTNMPRLVPLNENGRQQAAHLAAYLTSLTNRPKTTAITGSPKNGGAIFHQLACITCHGLPNDSKPNQNRIPLAHLSRKYHPSALKDYLLEPSKLAPHTRMPNFRLSDTEASDLSKYLLKASATSAASTLTFPPGDATLGQALAKERQCGACHSGLPYDATALPSFEHILQKSWLDAPCYQSDTHHLNLPNDAKQPLEALRKNHPNSLRQDTPSSFATRQLHNLRCHACHHQDDQLALLSSLHSESSFLATHLTQNEKIDQSLPALTHMGEMLHSDYLSEILAGNNHSQPRPWLETRMPSFTNHSPKLFAAGLAARHGLAPSQPKPIQPISQSLEIGKKLINSENGFGCTTCHAVEDLQATAAFEVKGINLNLTKNRLRENFFYRWMHNPKRLNPSTKMPRYSDEKGHTSLPDFNGDSRQQFEAIWHYLLSLEN